MGNDFELEAVSDTDTHEADLEKSANSSISLSDSNMGDHEVTSSTNGNLPLQENRLSKDMFDQEQERRIGVVNLPQQPIGLEGLETETISDNEEMSFDENDDNIEEGEIPSERPRLDTPPQRPRISMQLRRVIEVNPSPLILEGEYEEGEIVDELSKRKEKKKEKKDKNKKDKERKQDEDEEVDVVPETEEISTDPQSNNIDNGDKMQEEVVDSFSASADNQEIDPPVEKDVPSKETVQPTSEKSKTK